MVHINRILKRAASRCIDLCQISWLPHKHPLGIATHHLHRSSPQTSAFSVLPTSPHPLRKLFPLPPHVPKTPPTLSISANPRIQSQKRKPVALTQDLLTFAGVAGQPILQLFLFYDAPELPETFKGYDEFFAIPAVANAVKGGQRFSSYLTGTYGDGSLGIGTYG